jgi:hypothetical protein
VGARFGEGDEGNERNGKRVGGVVERAGCCEKVKRVPRSLYEQVQRVKVCGGEATCVSPPRFPFESALPSLTPLDTLSTQLGA